MRSPGALPVLHGGRAVGARPHGDDHAVTLTTSLLFGIGRSQQRSKFRSLTGLEASGKRRGDGADEQGRQAACC
jgi:hypothetical protein